MSWKIKLRGEEKGIIRNETLENAVQKYISVYLTVKS